jgi:hypothetical protein
MSPSASRRTSAPTNKLEDVLIDPAVITLQANAPEIFKELIRARNIESRHRRRLAWADLIAQVIGHLSGLVALGCLTVIAWHAIDRGDATQGASIICTGAVSIVAVFVTGRITNRNSDGKSASSDQNE